MRKILQYSNYLQQELLEREISSFYHKDLCPSFWDKQESGDSVKWEFDQRIRKKLVRIGKEFFNQFKGPLKQKDIKDIQLTGSLANFNWTELSELDIHIIVNFSGLNDKNPEILKGEINSIKFRWNTEHQIKIRGHEVELFINDSNEHHSESALFSLLENKWIKNPVYDPPEIDEKDIDKKYDSLVYDIEQLETKLTAADLPSNAKDLYKRCIRTKEKLQKIRKEYLRKGGNMSIGNLVFKKLKNKGYIEKLIDTTSKAYDKIYNEK